MQKNQYTKLINNVFSDKSNLDKILEYFPVWNTTDEVSLSVLWVLNEDEKDLLEKYIEYKKWYIDSLEVNESKEAKKIWMKLLSVISSFYDKIQSKERFWEGTFFYEKEQLIDKIKRNFHNPWLAFEYLLLSSIWNKDNSFYLAPQELENKQIDFLSDKKSSKQLEKDGFSYNPRYVIWWQLTVSSNINTLKEKLLNIEKTLEKIDNDEIIWLRIKDTPDLVSLIVVNGATSNFIKAQTRLKKDVDNTFTKALNWFTEYNYYGKLNDYLDDNLEEINNELNIISTSIKDVENIFDSFIVSTDLLKNQLSKVELETKEYSIESSYDKTKHVVFLKVFMNWDKTSLYEVQFFLTSKVEKKLILNSRTRRIKKISSLAKDIIPENNGSDLLSYFEKNDWTLPDDTTLEEASTIYNNKNTYEEQIESFINYFNEHKELQSWISLNDLIFLYKVLPESRLSCKNRIIWIVEWKNNFVQKIWTLTEVYKLSPDYWDLKEYSFKTVEDISIKNWLLTKEAEDYWFDLMESKVNQKKEFKIQVFALGLKILANHIIDYNKLKKIFNILKKQSNIVKNQSNFADLIDILLLKMIDSDFIKNNDSEEIIDDMIFLYQVSCCTREWKKIQHKIEKLYSYDNIKTYSNNNLQKLWSFNKDSEIYINSVFAFKNNSKDYNDYNYLLNEINDKLKLITIDEFIEEVLFLYNNSSEIIKKEIDQIIFKNNSKHCNKSNLLKYFNSINDYSLIISELNIKIKSISGLTFKSSSYISIDEKDKLDELKITLTDLLNEIYRLQANSITDLDQWISFYRDNPSNEMIDKILSDFVWDFEWLKKVYNILSNDNLILKEEIFNKLLSSLQIDKKYFYLGKLIINKASIDNSIIDNINGIDSISITKWKGDEYIITWNSRQFKEIIDMLWWDKCVDNISWELSTEFKDYISNILNLYSEWISKDFVDFDTMYSKLDETIINFEIWISILRYIFDSKWNKGNKSHIKEILINIIEKIEKLTDKSSHLDLDWIKVIHRLIQINEMKTLLKINDETKFEEGLLNNIDCVDNLLYLSKRFISYKSKKFKWEKEFILNAVEEKIYLVTNYDSWIDLYEKINSEVLLIKVIDLISNSEQAKNLYKYCKNDKLKELLLIKHISFINNIFNINDLKEIYNNSSTIFKNNTQKLEEILWTIYRNKSKILESNTDKVSELNLLLFIYKNTKDFSLKTLLIEDIIKKSNDFTNLYDIYLNIKNDNEGYIDNITKNSIIDKMKWYISPNNIVKTLHNLLRNNEEELLYGLKDELIKQSSTIKIYEELKKYYAIILKEDKVNKLDFIAVFLDRIKEKVIKNIKNIEKLKIELKESVKSTQKKTILNRMLNISDSFDTLSYIYNVCNKNTFAKSYVIKTRKIIISKLKLAASSFSDFEFLYHNSTTQPLKTKYLLKMKSSILNITDLIKLYSITNDINLINNIDNIITILNYKEYFEISKQYPEIRIRILEIIINDDKFNGLSFDELKNIYNKIRKNEKFKLYNEVLFVSLLNKIENISEFGDIITIYDTSSFLWEKSLNLLKKKIHINILLFGKWFPEIDNKLSDIKSIELKDFILYEIDFYFKDISNITSALEIWEWTDNMVVLRSKLIKNWTYLLQSMELLKYDKLLETFLYFKYIDNKKTFNNLLVNKLKEIWFLNKTWLYYHISNDNLDEINEYIISNWNIDITKFDDYKKGDWIFSNDELENIKKYIFVHISENWNILKWFVDEWKDELYHIIFNKTL